MDGFLSTRKKESAGQLITINVTITPTSGDATKEEVRVPATGTTVRAVLEKLGISGRLKDLFVNDKFADLDTHVTDGQRLRVAERPSGS